MYQRNNKNEIVFDYFSGVYPSKHLNTQIKYLENVQREMEARKTKVANTL